LTVPTDRLYPSEALVVFQGKQSKAMADQLTTISKMRLIQKAAVLSGEEIHEVERTVKLQLGML